MSGTSLTREIFTGSLPDFEPTLAIGSFMDNILRASNNDADLLL